MNSDNLCYWLVVGVSLMYGLGHGDKIDQLMAYLSQHSAPLGWLALMITVPALFVAWLALGHDKRIDEEDNF